MISTPGHRDLRRRQRRALPACFACRRASSFSRQSRLRSSGAAQPVARARWRRCFAFSLAFCLLARIVLLDLAVFIIRAPILIRSAPSYRISFAQGRRVELGVAQSRIPLSPKPTSSASLRKGALPSVPSQRPMGKRATAPLRSVRRAATQGRGGVGLSAGPRKPVPQPPQVRAAERWSRESGKSGRSHPPLTFP
jgi:hypothetical protein